MNKHEIIESAREILRAPCGNRWFKGFLKRNPKIWAIYLEKVKDEKELRLGIKRRMRELEYSLEIADIEDRI